MKLWRIIPVDDEPNSWDTVQGFVIRAEDEMEARAIAATNHWDEGADFWLDASKSKCDELLQSGPPEIILRDALHG